MSENTTTSRKKPVPFSDYLWAEIRKEFGQHCMRLKEYRKANENFRSSLEKQPNKLDSVFCLTNSQAREAKLDDALELLNEKSGLAAFKHHFKCNLQECDCKYEKNEFEESLLLISEKAQQYQKAKVHIPHGTMSLSKKQNEARKKGPKVSAMRERFETIRTNFDDMIGKNAGNCLYSQRQYFDKIMESWKPGVNWKNASEQNKSSDCDVVSVLEENVEHKTVSEKHRIDVNQRKFAQCYMQSSWQDCAFIAGLKANKILSKSTQNAESFKIISNAIDECGEATRTLIHQLHARCPLYTYSSKMFADPKHMKKANMESRFRMQYQTRRDMFTALDAMHECRARGELKKLIKIAEHELGVHYQIKSQKLMPRKSEFTMEICNLIGLAHLDELKMPSKLAGGLELLAEILDVTVANKYSIVPYVFGDQSTYRDPAEPDTSFLVFKRNINRLEERLKQSRTPIENCHLYHEMGKQNLAQNKYDDTRSWGRRIIDEAHGIGNYLWEFLGQILVCRADVTQKNYIKINENLKAASNKVDVFGNPELSRVILLALEISEGLL